ncbi:11327_t:CDS:2, partial [Cetraspora pellucida]
MHLEMGSEENQKYAQWFLEVGNGTNTSRLDNTISLPEQMKAGTDIKDRTILSAQNDDVQNINHAILNVFFGVQCTYLSTDNAVIEEGADNNNVYPVEYLNSLNPSGMPPSKLNLKIGCPIMLLRNLASSQGLCNGSRLT